MWSVPRIRRASSRARFGEFTSGHSRPLMAMIEVTNRCNMDCPVCFSNSTSHSHDVPLTKIRRRMERLLKVTATPIPIQISGGEPTLRRDLPEIVALAKNLGYRHIELITNGIKIEGNCLKLYGKLKLYDVQPEFWNFI